MLDAEGDDAAAGLETTNRRLNNLWNFTWQCPGVVIVVRQLKVDFVKIPNRPAFFAGLQHRTTERDEALGDVGGGVLAWVAFFFADELLSGADHSVNATKFVATEALIVALGLVGGSTIGERQGGLLTQRFCRETGSDAERVEVTAEASGRTTLPVPVSSQKCLDETKLKAEIAGYAGH